MVDGGKFQKSNQLVQGEFMVCLFSFSLSGKKKRLAGK